jgi:MFS transporter, DHA3 family, macrolide efflux protein
MQQALSSKTDSKSLTRFLIVWSGQLISSIGSGMTAFALGIYVFQKTNSATTYSLIILAAFLPSFILKPFGGVMADRIDRKLLMIAGDLGSALGLVFILFMFYTGNSELWVIYTGVIFSSGFVALQNPAYKASATDLLSEDDFAKASGLMQLAESSKFLVSPVIAGILLIYINIQSVLIIDIMTFLIAVIAVFWIRKGTGRLSNQDDNHFFSELKNGFLYIYSQKGIFRLLIITSVITFLIGFLQALVGPMMLVFADPETLGFTQSISATGMIVSSFWIGIFSKSIQQIKILSISLTFAGIFYALFGVSTNVYFIIASGFLFFMMLPFINTSLDVLIRKNTDNSMQGRVWSNVSIISQSGYLIAYSIAGTLADRLFNPLLLTDGYLASTIGNIIGTGPGRGIGFMFILSGILVSVVGLFIPLLKNIRKLENNY